MLCPLCEHPMTERQVSGIAVDRCGGCGAIYFDRHELGRVVGEDELLEATLRRAMRPRSSCRVCSEPVVEVAEHCDQPLRLRCPRCEAVMSMARTQGGFELELCQFCGGVLTPGEVWEPGLTSGQLVGERAPERGPRLSLSMSGSAMDTLLANQGRESRAQMFAGHSALGALLMLVMDDL